MREITETGKTETGKTETGRQVCLACRARLSGKWLMELENLPASAQDIPGAEDLETDKGICLRLVQCPNCGLVQFPCEPVTYYRDVIRAGGGSSTMTELRRRQYRDLIQNYGLEGGRLIEVGCGQGEFLNILKEFPVQAFGVEHREELVIRARSQGLCVQRGFAGGADIRFDEGPFDGFLSFNFLEHQPDPGAMLDCIYENLNSGGIGLITVPSFEYILQYNGYYELIRDHLAYYTFGTLRRLLESHGFEVLEEEMVNRDTLSVIVRKVTGAVSGSPGLEAGIECFNADVSGLEKSYHRIQNQINELLQEYQGKGKSLAVWGASHQGFTLTATTRLKDEITAIIDSAPFKQGRYAPASHVPIISPDQALKESVDGILIVAPGYTEEIAGIIRRRFGEQADIYTLRSSDIEKI